MVIKAITAASIGIIPGALFLLIGQPLPLGILIMILGAFIGLAFALAKISARNVAGLTAGVIVAYNAPRCLRGAIIDKFDGSARGDAEHEDVSNEMGTHDGGEPADRPN